MSTESGGGFLSFLPCSSCMQATTTAEDDIDVDDNLGEPGQEACENNKLVGAGEGYGATDDTVTISNPEENGVIEEGKLAHEQETLEDNGIIDSALEPSDAIEGNAVETVAETEGTTLFNPLQSFTSFSGQIVQQMSQATSAASEQMAEQMALVSSAVDSASEQVVGQMAQMSSAVDSAVTSAVDSAVNTARLLSVTEEVDAGSEVIEEPVPDEEEPEPANSEEFENQSLPSDYRSQSALFYNETANFSFDRSFDAASLDGALLSLKNRKKNRRFFPKFRFKKKKKLKSTLSYLSLPFVGVC